jgi:hypothetical protein
MTYPYWTRHERWASRIVSFILDVQLHCRACQTIIVAFCLCNGVALASQKKIGYWYTKAPTFGENNDLLANLQTNTLHVN